MGEACSRFSTSNVISLHMKYDIIISMSVYVYKAYRIVIMLQFIVSYAYFNLFDRDIGF